eukprot:2471300-Rhodomonas_salina.1
MLCCPANSRAKRAFGTIRSSSDRAGRAANICSTAARVSLVTTLVCAVGSITEDRQTEDVWSGVVGECNPGTPGTVAASERRARSAREKKLLQ